MSMHSNKGEVPAADWKGFLLLQVEPVQRWTQAVIKWCSILLHWILWDLYVSQWLSFLYIHILVLIYLLRVWFFKWDKASWYKCKRCSIAPELWVAGEDSGKEEYILKWSEAYFLFLKEMLFISIFIVTFFSGWFTYT